MTDSEKPRDEQVPAQKTVPNLPFRVLDAPNLKDDYYCSILAYCYTCHTLAVALGHRVYLWTEKYGVKTPPLLGTRTTNFVTSLAFSSEAGGRGILAVARNSGNVTLFSLRENEPRYEVPHPCAASCVSFKPTLSQRVDFTGAGMTLCEDLLVGDDSGKIYYYSLEWPEHSPGSITLLAKIDAHTQNVCGLSWAPDGLHFVSGGNDNRALLFDPQVFLYSDLLAPISGRDAGVRASSAVPSLSARADVLTPPQSPVRQGHSRRVETAATDRPILALPHGAVQTPPTSPVRQGRAQARMFNNAWPSDQNIPPPRHQPILRNALADPSVLGQSNVHLYSFYHFAAVKAIAFASWQADLLATGGGSNDRQIHFFHTGSGATLALINVFSQVTSLIWSTTRREIVATFGYSQPEHEIRIAVFSWPSCECIVSIPWDRKQNGEVGRALWAIPYPGGPNDAVPSRRQTDNNNGFAA
jgi:hypothetical protein